METAPVGTKPSQRADADILENIWNAFQKEDVVRFLDIQDVSMAVEEGQVFLSGHVARSLNQQRMEDMARSVPGVAAVHNHLVSDQDLTVQVARALGKNELVRSFVIPVYCFHGWISLGGAVPSRELQRAAEIAAAQIPTVRGVISGPRVMGEGEDAPRLALQPRIGARMYGGNETEGTISQAIIRPENRLVSHAVVRMKLGKEGCGAAGDYLVPVEAMDLVNEEEVFLFLDAPAINTFPLFLARDYPIAPLTWQPPYPYVVGRVRWPRDEKLLVEMDPRTPTASILPEEMFGMLKSGNPR